MSSEVALRDRVQVVRAFNRFLTRKIGVLREGLLHSPYTLTEARILYELAQRPDQTATTLGRDLGLDPGYLSRLLVRLQEQGLLERLPSGQDARQRLLHLTTDGQAAFAELDQRSAAEVAGVLAALPEPEQRRLVAAMQSVQDLLGAEFGDARPFSLRQQEPGDMGWVVSRHGALYAREYGWNADFEALVAEIVAGFLRHFDAGRERCFIAEMAGRPVGSVFIVQGEQRRVAKLRLLLVEPEARGLGLGQRLVEEAVRFAQRAGYQRVSLWTNSVLEAARHLYQRAGFVLVAQEPHHSFGHDLIGETWERTL